MRRRDFIKLAATAPGAAIFGSCGDGSRRCRTAAGRRVLLVAFDGLDRRVLQSMIDARRLPNFARLAETGSFEPLRTSTPPHTPVAFANIISGADPGLHNIFDFIHRDPNPPEPGRAMRIHLSTSEAVAPESDWAIPMGGWRLPLVGGKTELLRRGPAFWDYLVEAGIDVDVYYVPSNYPPEPPQGPGRFRAIGGMGTPDLLGGLGEFTLLTPDAPHRGRRVGGGKFVHLAMQGHRGKAELVGPPNFLKSPDAKGRTGLLTASLDIVRDPESPVAKIEVSGTVVLLGEGEWSDWVPVEFPTGIPGSSVLGAAGAPTSVYGMVRMYLRQVHPKLELYLSPINIDPSAPAVPISAPAGFAPALSERHGRFYTLGIPEDTKALSGGALSEDQFLAQSELASEERVAQYHRALAEFKQGCLFFYFGATDLLQHMFWRDRDPQHPGHNPQQADRYGQVVDDIYVAADRLVADALKAIGPEDTLIVLSDHGLTTFRRGFNLNSWLTDNGYIRLIRPSRRGKSGGLANINWSDTRMYGLGLNALYVNAAGREKRGVVKPGQRRSLLGEIRDKLLAVRDGDGSPVIHSVDLVEEIYPGADANVAPDLIVGYSEGYRASWETALGDMPLALLEDNLDRWSGTHLIAAELVPGVLLSNRRLVVADPNLSDIAPTILDQFAVAKPPQMTGRPLFAGTTHGPMEK